MAVRVHSGDRVHVHSGAGGGDLDIDNAETLPVQQMSQPLGQLEARSIRFAAAHGATRTETWDVE